MESTVVTNDNPLLFIEKSSISCAQIAKSIRVELINRKACLDHNNPDVMPYAMRVKVSHQNILEKAIDLINITSFSCDCSFVLFQLEEDGKENGNRSKSGYKIIIKWDDIMQYLKLQISNNGIGLPENVALEIAVMVQYADKESAEIKNIELCSPICGQGLDLENF